LYALAYAGNAEVYQLLPLSDEIAPHAAFPKAKPPCCVLSRSMTRFRKLTFRSGVILMDYDWNWRGAGTFISKAIELNPNYAAAHQVYGTLLLRLGRIGDAILELKKAQSIDPLSPAINTWMGEAFAQLGRRTKQRYDPHETTRARTGLFLRLLLSRSVVRQDRPARGGSEGGRSCRRSCR
jgi:tetratricopeptide (TPR) repeat protein